LEQSLAVDINCVEDREQKEEEKRGSEVEENQEREIGS